MCADNPDVREIATVEALIESATAKLADARRRRDELKAERERLQPVQDEDDGSCSQRTSSATEEPPDDKDGGRLQPDDVREGATQE